ncbi:MAG: response regulator [SAR324 cluster bacterium]|nr:response regulator [SAR324 cluster bacterium]
MYTIQNIVVIKQSNDTLKILHAAGYKIIEARDGIEGIRKVIRFRPDLIITKIELPHLNGLSMINILDTFAIHTPVIFTSSSPLNEKRARKFKSTTGFLLDTAVKEKLADTITHCASTHTEKFLDTQYHFRQHEWADLMGVSNRKRLLLVEDSSLMRQFSLNILDPTDEFELYSADSGLDGLIKALLTKPDLILSDVEMPKMDGITMSQVLFILGKPFPIVFLSAKEDDRIINKAKNLDGVIGYIVKNQVKEKDEFLRQIRDHLEMAATLKESSQQSYEKGSLDQLAKTGTEQGILRPGQNLNVSPSAQKKLSQHHNQGLGAFWSKPQ